MSAQAAAAQRELRCICPGDREIGSSSKATRCTELRSPATLLAMQTSTSVRNSTNGKARSGLPRREIHLPARRRPLRHVKNPREREPAFQTATSPETPGVCSTRNLQPEQVTTSLYTVAVPYPSRGISPPAKQNALRVRRAWASQEKRTAMKSKTRSSPECAEYENLLKKKERETEEHFCALRAKLLWSFAG